MPENATFEAREKLFSFAVISDTHVNPDDDQCNSPFPVNARANRRFRHVVSDLNQREIDFVVHLGDLVHPVPDTGDLYGLAADAYRRIVSDLNVPIHAVPGNHDIGDTPIKGAPRWPNNAGYDRRLDERVWCADASVHARRYSLHVVECAADQFRSAR